MRIVMQRVSQAQVDVDEKTIAKIGPGLLLLVGVAPDDRDEDAAWSAGKITRMRIFSDAQGKMNLSVLDMGGEILAISQFTLYAETARGNRPSFSAAAAPDFAKKQYERFVEQLVTALGKPVGMGIFGADMHVSLINQGPVTIILDSQRRQ